MAREETQGNNRRISPKGGIAKKFLGIRGGPLNKEALLPEGPTY